MCTWFILLCSLLLEASVPKSAATSRVLPPRTLYWLGFFEPSKRQDPGLPLTVLGTTKMERLEAVEIERVVARLARDSADSLKLVGWQFVETTHEHPMMFESGGETIVVGLAEAGSYMKVSLCQMDSARIVATVAALPVKSSQVLVARTRFDRREVLLALIVPQGQQSVDADIMAGDYHRGQFLPLHARECLTCEAGCAAP